MEEESIRQMEQQWIEEVLWGCIGSLPRSQQEVLRKRYQEGADAEAISGEWRLSRDAVKRLESEALGELRKPKNSRRLRPCLTWGERNPQKDRNLWEGRNRKDDRNPWKDRDSRVFAN